MLKQRSVIYARYSSDKQNDATIEVQLNHCRTLAGPNPLEYIDKAISGTTIQRPGFQRMLQDAEAGLYDRLIVYKFDRIGRTGYTHAICSDLINAGIKIISTCEGDNPLSMGIHLVVSELFSRELGKRVRDSLELRFQRRVWTGGPPSFGYKIIHRDNAQYLTVNQTEAKIVKIIFMAYIEETVGTKEIARRLIARALPTRHGGSWSFTMVRQILINQTLRGEVKFGKRKMRHNKNGKRVPTWNDPATVRSYQDESLRIITDDD